MSKLIGPLAVWPLNPLTISELSNVGKVNVGKVDASPAPKSRLDIN